MTATSPQPDQLAQLLRDAEGNDPTAPAPLEQWNPTYCGQMDLTIQANGDWYHEGSPLTRENLLKLFARVLWRETEGGQDRYFLKTPAEKIEIQVEDAPLLVNDADTLEAEGQHWVRVQTKTGDRVLLDAEHPLEMRIYEGQLRPYVRIRRNLDALVHRNVFYRWIEQAETDAQGELWLVSGDQRFSLGKWD